MNLGLCLEGGGAKGAFSAKILYELYKLLGSLDFKAASGSSVGGLNASLALIGDFESLDKAWNTIGNNQIYTFWPSIFSKSIYSTRPLKRFLSKKIKDLKIVERLKTSKKKLFLCSVILEKNEVYYFNEFRDYNDLLLAFMATSAIPFLFPPQIIKGENYVDGGTKTSLPIDPLIDMGMKKIICIVHSPINSSFNFKLGTLKSYINNIIEVVTINHTLCDISKWNRVSEDIFLYRGAEIFLIFPETQLPAVLDFSKKSVLFSKKHASDVLEKVYPKIKKFLSS